MSGVAALSCVAVLAAGCADQLVAPDRAAAPPALGVSAEGRGNRHIVLLREGQEGLAAEATVQTAVQALGGRVERAHPEIGVLSVRGLSEVAAARLASRPEVEGLALDRVIRFIPPRERFRSAPRRRIRSASDQRDAVFFDRFQWNIRRIRADDAWLVTNQGRRTTVCILDTGVDPRHIELAGKFRFDMSASFVGGELAIRDFDGHGTAMASVVATNGLGIASVAPDARLCSIKVLNREGRGSFLDVIAGIYHAGVVGGFLGVDVANMSLGAYFSRSEPGAQVIINAGQRAVNFAVGRGVLVVASAGNAGRNLNRDGDFFHWPSELDNVISVGATGPINQRNFDRIASYSNFGRSGVDVFAPGGEFVHFPPVVLEDLIIMACSPSIRVRGFEYCRERDGYLLGAGTSPAAAHVSGEAAVIQSELPGDQSPARLTSCILNSADPLPNPVLTANGRINVLRGARCTGNPKGRMVASQ